MPIQPRTLTTGTHTHKQNGINQFEMIHHPIHFEIVENQTKGVYQFLQFECIVFSHLEFSEMTISKIYSPLTRIRVNCS